MPYIAAPQRPELERKLASLIATVPFLSTGALNYCITRIVQGYLNGKATPPTYSDFNDAMGVLECVKMELYRRVVVEYEDKKRAENGDVY